MQFIAPIMAIAGAVTSFVGQQRQASALEEAAEQQRAAAAQAERISMQNAANIEAETAESVRRESAAATEAESLRRARVAASGGMDTGSTAAFLETQSEREQEYIGWLGRSGASQATIERERGRLASMEGETVAGMTENRARQARTRGFGALIGGGARAAGDLYDIYNP